MKSAFEIEISPDDPKLRMIHQEGIETFAEHLGGEISTSCRASNVEWEEVGERKGWTVRSAFKNELALRWMDAKKVTTGVHIHPLVIVVSEEGDLVVFPTREEAIEEEIKHFWELLAPSREANK